MGRDQVVANALAQVHGEALGETAGVDEDQRRAVLHGQFGEAVVDLAPHFIAGDGAEFRRRDLDGEIELAAMADVDDGGGGVAG